MVEGDSTRPVRCRTPPDPTRFAPQDFGNPLTPTHGGRVVTSEKKTEKIDGAKKNSVTFVVLGEENEGLLHSKTDRIDYLVRYSRGPPFKRIK